MIKKMLSDRKGVAIELAILMTVVCFAVATIVLSAALLQYENKVQAQQRMEENIIFEQIVEKFTTLTHKSDIKDWVEENYAQYTAAFVDEVLTVQKDGKTVLTIEISGNTITKWKKG